MSAQAPQVVSEFLETVRRSTPWGKGPGEAGTIGAPGAITNAVMDALGIAHFDFPMTPPRIWRALHENAG